MHTKARKVMIIGAGNVGASAAYALLNQSICEELILVDLNQQRAEAHAQDLSDAAAYLPGMMTISTREASDCADVDIAVITVSGGALRPGQSRLDELTSTAKIVKSIVPTMMANGFNGIFLVATNPCDIITGRYGSFPACRAARCWAPASGWIPPACVACWRRNWRLAPRASTPLSSASMAIPSFRCGRTPRYMARQSPTSTSSAPACRSIARRWLTKCASWDLRSTRVKAAPNMAWQGPSPDLPQYLHRQPPRAGGLLHS